MTILPWEDANEFKQLHAALIDEWKPVGPTEHDAVFSLAKAMWRKRRMQFFMHIERMRVSVEPNHEAYDEAKTLRGLSAYIEAEPDGVDRALTLLLPDRIAEHLRQTLPRASFQSVSKWVHAIQKEIALVLLPAAERFEGFDMMINRDVDFSRIRSLRMNLPLRTASTR